MTRIEEEKRVVRWMIELFCRKNHGGKCNCSGNLYGSDNQNSGGVQNGGEKKKLCAECEELAAYCDNRLEHCRFGEEKPTCKKCPVHCYKPEMREKIREVMRFSGPRMIFHHPIAAIRHLMR